MAFRTTPADGQPIEQMIVSGTNNFASSIADEIVLWNLFGKIF